MLITSSNKSSIKKLKTQPSAAKKILGMEIHMDCQAGRVFLSQKKYIKKVLESWDVWYE